MTLRIGVLAYQGDVSEHLAAMARASTDGAVVPVRKPEQLDGLSGLIIPGGESTAISEVLGSFTSAIADAGDRMAIWGTCAGAITLSTEVIDPDGSIDRKVTPLRRMSIATIRNFYGSQKDSFEMPVELKGVGRFPAVFIRAPAIERAWGDADVLGRFDGKIIMVRERNMLATTFHPELVKDTRVHEYFLDMAREMR